MTAAKVLVVRCLSCLHEARLPANALLRVGVKSDAPIAGFVKRLRCMRCGSGRAPGRSRGRHVQEAHRDTCKGSRLRTTIARSQRRCYRRLAAESRY
jgi:hypothetical protein